MTEILLNNFYCVLCMMACVWLASLFLRDVSLVDRFWGMGFVVVAISTFYHDGQSNIRALLLLVMTLVWGLRLSIFLTKRNWGKVKMRVMCKYDSIRENIFLS